MITQLNNPKYGLKHVNFENAKKIDEKNNHNCRPWPHQIFLESKPRELRFGVDQTLIQMKVLTKGFRDPMVKFKVMVKRRVAMA